MRLIDLLRKSRFGRSKIIQGERKEVYEKYLFQFYCDGGNKKEHRFAVGSKVDAVKIQPLRENIKEKGDQ